MLTIKEFADLCQTTRKTIFHYQKLGLIKPSGYRGKNRLYKEDQVLDFQKACLLKDFNFSLAEVRKLLKKKNWEWDLKIKRLELADLKQKLELRLKDINKYVRNLEKEKYFINPKVKYAGPYHMYTIKKTGSYNDIGKFDKELAAKVNDRHFSRCYMTVFNTPKYSPKLSSMTIGVVMNWANLKPVDGLEISHIPSQKVLSYTHTGSYRYLSYLWQFMFRYRKEKNFKFNLNYPEREVYIIGTLRKKADEKHITELQIPII